jgi:SAM-dependent methyltransferase
VVKVHEQSLERLLNVLVSMNLLMVVNGMYCNSKVASKYLVKGNDRYLGALLHHKANLWECWEQLEDRVRHGIKKEPDEKYLRDYHHRLNDYLSAMENDAQVKAITVANLLPLDYYENMLDLGGGPGTYACEFAKHNPRLHCTIVDLEPHLTFARGKINKYGLGERVTILPCELLNDDIPASGFDFIFISNLLHIYNSDEVEIILRKAIHTAADNAEIVIHDYILDEAGDGSLHASLFDLTMMVGTLHGKCYTICEMRELLESVGAHDIRHVQVGLGSSLVVGKKYKA